MTKYDSLIQVLPPRCLPEGVELQVGAVTPYRALVACDASGAYQVECIPDSSELPVGNAIAYVVSCKRFLTGLCPSDAATLFALSLFGLFPELRGNACLCIDANGIEPSALAAALAESGSTLLYADDEELAGLSAPYALPDAMKLTYRKQVIWNGDVPREWVERLVWEERFRKYNLMLSRSSHAVDTALAGGGNRRYYRPETKKYDASQLSEVIRLLGCGYVDSEFETVPRPSIGSSSPIERFVEQNVSFAHVGELLAEATVEGPDSVLLRDVVALWREIAFAEDLPERADLLALPLGKIASKHALDTYVDALASGVPLEDLLA